MNKCKNNKNEVRSRNYKIINELAPYTTLGIQIVLTISFCVWIGWIIDNKYGTEPIFLIILSFCGAIAAMVNFIKTVMKKKK